MSNLPKISVPVSQALVVAGISSLEQLSQHTEREIAALHSIGKQGIKLMKIALETQGLSFATASKDSNLI
jgi:DNA-directed RNA polymerase alpha subunit